MSEPTPHKAETPGLTLVACANQPWTYQRTEGPLEKYGRYSVKCSTGQTQFYVNSQIEARSIVVLAYAYSQLTQLTEERDTSEAARKATMKVLLKKADQLTASESRVKALEQACQPLVQRMKDAESLGRPSLVAIKYEKLAALKARLTPAPSQPNASSDTSHDTND